MGLRLASPETKRIELADGAWVDVATDIDKRTFRRIITRMPSRPDLQETGFTIDEGMDFQTGLFEGLVRDWSLTDAKGKRVRPSVEAYEALRREDAEELDTALAEHFGELTPSKEEQGKP